MHFYQFNIGDYKRDTSHLTLLEHGIYRQLIDLYYLEEKPLDANALRLICARTAEEKECAQNILDEFFTKTADGKYEHARCKQEMERIYAKSDKARLSAEKRWNKGNYANAMRTHNDGNANGMLPNNPLPNNPILNPLVANDVDDGMPACPHKEIIALYHEHLPMMTRVKQWTPKRADQLRARWRENKKHQNLEFWKGFFIYVSTRDWLTGRENKWQADLEWLTKSQNFVKVIEGKYQNKDEA